MINQAAGRWQQGEFKGRMRKPSTARCRCLLSQWIPLPLKIDDFAALLDEFVKLEVPPHFVFHNRVVDDIIDGVAGEAQDLTKWMLNEDV
jgi:hypothetical protein